MSKLHHWFSEALGALAIAATLTGVAGCGGIVDRTEPTSELEGELVIRAGIRPDGSRFVTHILQSSGLPDRELEFSKTPDLRSGVRLRVDGQRLADQKIQVRDYIVVKPPRAELGTVRQPVIQHGPRRVGAILVHWNQPSFFGPADVRNSIVNSPTSASALFSESSFGKVSLTADAFGWFQIQAPDGCNVDQIRDRGMAAAQAAGIDLTSYQHLAFVFNPDTVVCNFGGLGEVGTPGTPTRTTWYNNWIDPFVFVHEFGHNLGLLHSHAHFCPNAINARSECQPYNPADISQEYGDPFDPQGSGLTHFNAYHKAAQNWLTGCNVVTTPRSGVFTISPTETATTATQALRVPISAANCPEDIQGPCYYYVERRRPLGAFDSAELYSPMVNGVLIHTGPAVDSSGNTFLNGPFLLDTTPASDFPFGTFWDASLAVGRAFSDPSGVRIRVLSETATTARVAVKVPNGTGGMSCADGTPVLQPASCGNNVKGQAETDIDCGGSLCLPCDDGKICTVHADCWSDNCVSGICQPACDDGAKNGTETDVDCGGASCADCRIGQHCSANGDCLSGVCNNGTCSTNQLLATLTVHSDWSTGFCGQISLQNVAPQVTSTWNLGVNFEGSTFTSTSGGEFSPAGGGGVTTITPPPWGHQIWPSSFHTISFCATKTSSNYFPEMLFTNVTY